MSYASDVLDADTLLKKAQAETGLKDWGDSKFPDRFRHAVDLLDRCFMPEEGQRAAAGVCHWLLTDRLKFFNDFKVYPDIANEKIEAPLFATGAARSGTT